MGRPAELLDIGNPKNRVLRWVSESGAHHRALFLDVRGQVVQARISGYGMKPRNWFASGLTGLPTELLLIVNGWGPGWRVERTKAVPSPLPYAHIAAWLVRTSPATLQGGRVVAAPAGHVVNQLGLAL